MKRNDKKDDIRNARKRAKKQNKMKTNENITNEEKEDVKKKLDENEQKEELNVSDKEDIKEKNVENKESVDIKDITNEEENIVEADNADEEEQIEEQVIENEENINEEEQKVNKNKKKIYIVAVCFLILIGIIYFCTKRYDNLVYPNVTLYSQDVSKLNKSELSKKINTMSNDISKNTITVKINNQPYKIKLGEIIDDFGEEKLENKIMSYGKNKFFLEQFGLIYLGVNRDYNFDIKINESKMGEKVREIYKKTTTSPVEPTLKLNRENISVVSGKYGKGIDEKALIKKIRNLIKSNGVVKNNIVLTQKFKTIKPKINEKDLATVKDRISTATTYFGGTGYNRGLNIANAASKINGTLLMPGEEFSYEESVSPVELYNGYYLAPVIVDGVHKNAPGGGVCQVCTTLYNAELKAGILPTERHNHSKTIGYIKMGLDATLATGSKNLRFKNPYKYPIYIHAYTVGGQITVEIWSNKSVLEGKKYIPTSFVSGNVANTYLYGYNSKGKLIYKKFIDTSVYR